MSGIINDILTQIQDTIFDMGYLAGKETSLLVTERREPDIFVQFAPQTTNASQSELELHN